MSSPTAPTLELQEAADVLGVHYQTAYRWVRSGRLPAQLVGGKYRVDPADVERAADERTRPSAPSAPGTARLDRQAVRMHEALLAGDEFEARVIARKLVDDGARVTDLIEAVIVPPLRDIGAAWHEGRLTIWTEHRASAIVERLLGDLVPNPRGRRRGVVMVAAVAGDLHSLPTTMAATALRENNWHVHHLGADLPVDEIIGFCATHDVDVAVLSVTNPDAAEQAARAGAELREAGTPAIVGGAGHTLTELVALVQDLVAGG